MGYASLLEDTIERYAEGTGLTGATGGLTPRGMSVEEAVATLAGAYETVPESQRQLRDLTGSFLGKINGLVALLESTAPLADHAHHDPGPAWQEFEVTRQRLLESFARPDGLSLSLPSDLARWERQLAQLRIDAGYLRTHVRPILAKASPPSDNSWTAS